MSAGVIGEVIESARTGTRWGAGQLLAQCGLAGVTDYTAGIVARTATAGCGFDLKLPALGRVVFSRAQPISAFLGGDYFELTLEDGHSVRGVFPDAWHLLIAGPCVVEGEAYSVRRADGLTLLGVPDRFDGRHLFTDVDVEFNRRHAWLAQNEARRTPPEDVGVAEALTKAILSVRTQIQSPQGQIAVRWTTPDRWPHRDLWLWDSVFHAAGLRHLDHRLAQDAIEAVFCGQMDAGFIPHQVSPAKRSAITQPPLLAFGVELLVRDERDLLWAGRFYEPLRRYLAWNESNRDRDGNGLLEWFIEEHVHCRSGESGMDNSPRFDDAVALDAVDFNAFMANEYRVMARLARMLGRTADAAAYHRRWRDHTDRINRYLWDEETGFYHDFDPARGRRTPVLSSAGFLPLLCGAASAVQAERLVAHLSDPSTFGTPLPVPSVARASSGGAAKDMWRGPVWINLNWLIARGLRDYGHAAEADRILHASVAEMTRQYQAYGTFFEYYDAEMADDPPQLPRKGANAPQKSPFHQVIHEFGWSATLFIDMVLRP